MIKEIIRPDHCIRICDKCGNEKKVNYWGIKNKTEHLCRTCTNKSTANTRVGMGFKPWNTGTINQNISGNSYINNYGYRVYYIGDKSHKGGYIAEHRIVMELSLGRRLREGEVIHHINGNKQDNRLDNLSLTSAGGHRNLHYSLEKVSMQLVKLGIIKFENSEYKLDPDMWEHISESLELLETPTHNMRDNQQQSFLGNTKEECSTTIQKWSTLK